MRPLRGSSPALLLVLLTGAAALVPEAGHSRAHRDHAAPAAHDHDDHSQRAWTPAAAILGEHAADGHPHLDLLATTPLKLPLPHAAVARALLDVDDLTGRELRVFPVLAHGLAPPEQAQAPPPPSRAPPLA